VQEAKQAGEGYCVQILLVQLQLIQQKLKTIYMLVGQAYFSFAYSYTNTLHCFLIM
jgi:hypothetical protein